MPELADKYVGQVKLVYIDPPFNTAQTFVSYAEDNLEHSILAHHDARPTPTSEETALRRWFNLVHLDDAEMHRMRLLMDEIFRTSKFRSHHRLEPSEIMQLLGHATLSFRATTLSWFTASRVLSFPLRP